MSRTASLKASLDRLYDSFNAPDSAFDPVQVVQKYPRIEDREIIGFIASAVAFGRVAGVVNSTNAICAVLGDRPARFLRAFDPRVHGAPLRPLVHRWTRGDDFVALLWILRTLIDEFGSLENAFVEGLGSEDVDVGPAIERFCERARAVDLSPAYGSAGPGGSAGPAGSAGLQACDQPPPGVYFFFPRPSTGSACKRMNLFLRWMSRADGVDPGGWTRLPPSKLVIPLDTHIIRVGRCLRLTRYQSPGWKMAADITASLRKLDASDPVKYDFSLCHLGMMGGCRFGGAALQGPRAACQLAGVCHAKPSRSSISNRRRSKRRKAA